MSHADVIDDKYQIVRLLGEGGMGAVYEARHLGTGRRVAVKVILGEHVENEAVVSRFQREARAAGAIETQHIAHVLDTGTDRVTKNPYMVIEFLQGEDLQVCVKNNGPIDPDVALRVIAQACVGLQKAHEAGVVHRDIKPANLYLARQDDGAVIVKLLDFGIAKVKIDQMFSVENAALTRTGSLLGSPLYMSPEQARGSKSADARSDIWSLGIVFYEILAGVTPYAHCDTLGGLIFEICSAPPRAVQEIAPWVRPEIAAIVHKALTIDVARRYAKVADMLADVRALLPAGAALDTRMFAPLSPERRTSVAPKLSATATGLSMSSAKGGLTPSAQMAIQDANAVQAGSVPGQTGSTAAGLATSRAGARKSSLAAPIAIGAVVVLGLGGAAAYRFALPRTPASTAIAPLPPSAPAPSASAQPSASAPIAPATRTVQVTVTPASASVEVDGVATTVASDGAIALTGTPGSVHKVRVFVGKKETTADVVVAESGAVPSKIELGVKPPPSVAAVAKPGASAPVAAQTSPATPPPAAPPPPKPPPPSSPGLDRSFQ